MKGEKHRRSKKKNSISFCQPRQLPLGPQEGQREEHSGSNCGPPERNRKWWRLGSDPCEWTRPRHGDNGKNQKEDPRAHLAMLLPHDNSQISSDLILRDHACCVRALPSETASARLQISHH